LWWWQILQPDERRRVLCVYFERRTYNTRRFNPRLSLADRWQRVCEDFKCRCAKQRGTPGEIGEIIGLVTTSTVNAAVDRFGFFMTLEGAAVQLGLKKKNVYAWFKRLNEIARELYLDRCPPKITLTKEMEEAVRVEYLSKGNARELGERFHLPPFRIGQIVKAEKKVRRQRYAAINADEAPF
jgi:hypothetical protein